MIITCPHCQTKYQVTYEAIGSAGRKVQCAHCNEAWQQPPLSPKDEPPPEIKAAFEAIAEDALDEGIETEARKVAAAKPAQRGKATEEARREEAGAGKVDPAIIRMRQRAFSRRQHAVSESMPMAQLRRAARILGALALTGVLATSFFGRVQVVERFPDMAGVYEAIGLGVNVVGLDFSNVTTLQTLRDGKEVLIVSAQIVGLMPDPVPVPPVVITLHDAHEQAIYEWSVTPSVRDLMAQERATFDTQLTLPPGDIDHVRLSFAEDAPQPESAEPLVPGTAAEGHAPAADEHAQPTGEHAPVATDHAPATDAQTPAAEGHAPAAEHAEPAAPAEHGEAPAEHGAEPAHTPTPEHH